MAKWRRNKDPKLDREISKYQNPIPSREFIMQYLRECGKPVRRGDIFAAFEITEDAERDAMRRRLRAMERDGQIVFTRRGGYGLTDKLDLVRGRVSGHKDGFGFVIPEDGKTDLFLSNGEMRQVFDGDRVLARVVGTDRKGRREGEIVEVLERYATEIVGRFYIEGGVSFVIPEKKNITQDIIVPKDARGQAQSGQYVTVAITAWPSRRSQAVGSVMEVLGEHMAPGMEIDVAMRSYGLPHTWPEALHYEIDQLSEEVSDEDKQGRVDLRAKPFVTIDGEDAKDFDDAVYCEPGKRGRFTLFVAIADVSHYVKPHTSLDQEAYVRGTSVYFPGRVIPMLPEILSNGLCSLKPKTDRLAMVCEMSITASGKIADYKFYEAVIHSHARLTYTEVYKMLVEQHQVMRKHYQNLISHLEQLYALFEILHARREERGALEFDTTETQVIFDTERKIKQIVPYERNDAHRLIEECMLLANVSAANFLLHHKLPSLYRVHQGPNQDKLADVRKFLGEVGLTLRGGNNPKPKDYCRLLDEITDRPDAHLIQTVLLRSLSQAVYTPDNIGHFGLAYDSYTHFTSPIRRYPDLLVHRAIRHQLQHKSNHKYLYDHDNMVELGAHCSMTERRADEATRDVMDWLKCEYIQDRVGEEFAGIITSVCPFGIFVELKDIYVEGLVHVTALVNDYYHYDAVKHRMIGERTRTMYRLGDPVQVKVVRVDLAKREIDFELVAQKAGRKRTEKTQAKVKTKPKTRTEGKAKTKQKAKSKTNKKTKSTVKAKTKTRTRAKPKSKKKSRTTTKPRKKN